METGIRQMRPDEAGVVSALVRGVFDEYVGPVRFDDGELIFELEE